MSEISRTGHRLTAFTAAVLIGATLSGDTALPHPKLPTQVELNKQLDQSLQGVVNQELGLARDAVAHRFTSCTVTKLTDRHRKDRTGPLPRATVDFSLSLGLSESAKKSLADFADDNSVQWNEDIVTREAVDTPQHPADKYLSFVFSMKNTAHSPDQPPYKTHVQGSLYPMLHVPGGIIDIFKDETTEAAGKQTLNTIFCGRAVLKANQRDGELTWTLDPNVKKPLQPMWSGTLPSEAYHNYQTEQLTQVEPPKPR